MTQFYDTHENVMSHIPIKKCGIPSADFHENRKLLLVLPADLLNRISPRWDNKCGKDEQKARLLPLRKLRPSLCRFS